MSRVYAEEQERFLSAVEKARMLPDPEGIGRLNEGSLHKTLKLYFEPDISRHEIKIGRYVADVVNEDGIIEIQTRAFRNMKSKLEAFLSVGRVTVVFPIALKKDVVWLDPETGELSSPHKSPKKGSVYDIFPELSQIVEFVSEQRLTVKVMLMSMTDVRMLCGWDKSRKRGSHREDRIPRELFDIVTLDSAADYEWLVPQTLTGAFTVKDFAVSAGIDSKTASPALRVLRRLGVVRVTGKKKNAYIYEKNRP